MRYIVTFIITIITTVGALFGESATDKVNSLRETLQQHPVYKVDFTATFQGEFHDVKGSVIINNSGQYLLEMDDVTLLYDGKTQYNYIHSQKEITIENIPPNENPLTNPITLLEIDDTKYNIEYKSNSSNIVRLTPKVDNGVIKSFEVEFNSNNMAKKIDAVISNQQTFTLIIERVIKPYTCDSSIFKFAKEKYQGIEIIDLR